MEAKITAIPLVVKDKAKALDFFTNKVGFEKKTDYTAGSYRYATVGPKRQDIELALYQIGSPDPTGWIKNVSPGGPPIVMRVHDSQKTFGEMKSRGELLKQAQPEEHEWGVSATFSDPDGNLFPINQLPQKGLWQP